ncbi:MAG: hypothetical protein QM820_25615 [Minicystis sp.]
MRRWFRSTCSAVIVIFAAAPARADAGPEPVRFAWVRAEGADACASQEQIAERVTARLGKSPFAEVAARSIEAIVSRAEHGFRAGIYVRGKHGALAGSRELTSEALDCATIEAASVLAIALAIDPEASTRPAAAAPSAAPPTAAPNAVTPAPDAMTPAVLQPAPSASISAPPSITASPPAPRSPPPSSDRLGGSGLALRAGLGLGLLPAPAPGVSLAGHFALTRSAQITAEALFLPEARTSDGRFGFGLTALSVGACVVAFGGSAADLAACGSIWGGALHAVVYDLQPTAPGDYAWAGAAATPRLRVRIAPHVHAEVGAHVLVPITRRPFVVSGWADPVFRQAPVTVLPFAGLGVNFP